MPSAGTIAAVFLMSAATIVLCSLIALAPFYLNRDDSLPFDDEQLDPDYFTDDEHAWEAELREHAKQRHPSHKPSQ
jgi:hypothetical protein